jgi:tetratricopeptide (TPR) repeat protein
MNATRNFKRRMWKLAVGLLCLSFIPADGRLNGGETSQESAAGTNDTLRAYIQLQEQLHATQLALERNRQETEVMAARNAEAVAARFKAVEDALTAKRSGELEAMEQRMQSLHRLLLVVSGGIAAVGFLVLLLTAFLQWRAVNRLAEVTAMTQAVGRAALPQPVAVAAPLQLPGAGVAAQSNTRLFGALTGLEKRILELENAAHPTSGAGIAANGQDGHSAGDLHSVEGDHKSLLLAKGQSLLDLDKAAEALACFEEILATDPKHAEALVKKGAALEQLRNMDEALRCYDLAIASNSGLTIAYLQKGGLFNRLERYEEALQCYEQALHSQEKAHAA